MKFAHNDLSIGNPGQSGACAISDPPPPGSHISGSYCQQSPEDLETSLQKICDAVRASGSRCMITTEIGFRGEQDPAAVEALWGPGITGLCDDSGGGPGYGDNCASVFQRYNGLITRGNGVSTRGIGWRHMARGVPSAHPVFLFVAGLAMALAVARSVRGKGRVRMGPGRSGSPVAPR